MLQETVESVKRAFTAFHSIPASRLALSTLFEGIHGLVEVTEDMWAELLPNLRVVSVLVDYQPIRSAH
jgi:hypothetical protein